jgi:mono/diheme cytochrome c family protein
VRLAAVFLVAMAGAAARDARAASDYEGPQLDYALHCQGCHLVDGKGLPGAVPPLAGSVALLASRPGGREYLVRVPGVAQAALGDAALAALLDWVVARFAEGDVPAGFAPYTEEEVGRWRRRPLTDVGAARSALFAEAPAAR